MTYGDTRALESWGDDRFSMRSETDSLNVNEHFRCKECGRKAVCRPSWMRNGIKGKDKPYFVECSNLDCSYAGHPFWGDTPQEAMQQWDEEMTKKHTYKFTYEVVNTVSVSIVAETEEAREIFSNRQKEQKYRPRFSVFYGRPISSSTNILTVENLDNKD